MCFFGNRYVFQYDGKNSSNTTAAAAGPLLTGKLSSVEVKQVGAQSFKSYSFTNGRSVTVVMHEEVHIVTPHIAVAFDALSSALEELSALADVLTSLSQ